MNRKLGNTAVALLAFVLLGGIFAGPGSATVPGKNGRLLLQEVAANEDPRTDPDPPALYVSPSNRFSPIPATTSYQPWGAAFAPDGRNLAYWSGHSIFRIKPGPDAVPESIWDDYPAHGDPIYFSPDGARMIGAHFRSESPECGRGPCPPGPDILDPLNGVRVHNLKSGATKLLEFPPDFAVYDAQWSPSGRKLAMFAFDGSRTGLYVSGSIGQDPELIVDGTIRGFSFSPDSRWLAYGTVNGEIAKIRVDGTGGALFTEGERPVFSPDGTRIAYTNGEEAWTMRADGTDPEQFSDYLPRSLVSVVDWARAEPFRIRGFKRRDSNLAVRIWNPGIISVKGPLIAKSVRGTTGGVVMLPVKPRKNVRLAEGTKVRVTVTFRPEGGPKSVRKTVVKLG